MSDCDCNTNCSSAATDACDPEPIESQITNFITSFVGTLTKTSVNGVCVWTLPCDLGDEIPAFPREANEGVLCYIYRILATGASVGEANIGANVGAGSGWYRDKTGVTLNFKSVIAGLNTELTVAADTITIGFDWQTVPANSGSAGTAGQMAFNSTYGFICTATNTWARFPIAGVW